MRDYNGWEKVFLNEFDKPYFKQLKQFLLQEYAKKRIFPKEELIFNSFDNTSPEQLKVVLLGQDPYPTPGNAMGLCFSVPKGTRPLPPSLDNILDEIRRDTGKESIACDGDLTPWARQGVLLLNTTLTVEAYKPNSHKNHGWEQFTDQVIRYVNAIDKPIVFLLWGNDAKAKMKLLTNPLHLVLTAPHPSPLSVTRGFRGCGHFSKANDFLSQFTTPINW